MSCPLRHSSLVSLVPSLSRPWSLEFLGYLRRTLSCTDSKIGFSSYLFVNLESNCPLDFERIGCFRDNKKDPRPLPEYIITDRERGLNVSSGRSIDWRNWDVYMPDFVCRCAKKANEKGHSTFGVQFYGEYKD